MATVTRDRRGPALGVHAPGSCETGSSPPLRDLGQSPRGFRVAPLAGVLPQPPLNRCSVAT